MTDVELETRNFYVNLTHSDSHHHHNHLRNGTWNSKPGTSSSNKSSVKKSGDVVSASRPLNPWYEHQHQSPTLSTNFVRTVVRKGVTAEEEHSSHTAAKIPLQYHHIDVATVSGEDTVSGLLNGKKLNCAQNAASISPASASSNTETSHSSISMSGSSMSNSIDPNEDTYRATPCAASDSFHGLISPAKTYYHSGPPIRRRPRNLVNGGDVNRNERLLMNGNTVKKSLNDIRMNAKKQHFCNTSMAKKSMDSLTSTDSGVSVQRKKYDEITNSLEKQLNLNRKPIGICELCEKAILEEADVTCALGSRKKYCEEDYLYSGMHETAERCAACSHFIMDMVLHALGKSYHPRCFRCEKCKTCLDGIPFALDPQGHVYCTEDYHRLFAPKCAACLQAIMPNKKTGETVHVVAINRDYHIECYVCKGCGMQLTDEPEKRCYPLNDQLLCKNCHIHWVRTGGDSKLITDL
ncbi:Wilms tumor protein 1-interacting-like protein [Dirofilaria immitis]|nr:Wilms tumor protein 1-interacting-like protein [Dirofilaria immitis]